MERLVFNKNSSDSYLNEIKDTFLSNYGIDLDKYFEPAFSYSGSINFKRNIYALHNNINELGNALDYKFNLQVNPFTLLENDILKENHNYYNTYNSNTTRDNTLIYSPRNENAIHRLIKNKNGSQTVQISMNSKDKDDNDYKNRKYLTTESPPSSNPLYNMMQHEINKMTTNSCYIQDILYDIYFSLKYFKRELISIQTYTNREDLIFLEISEKIKKLLNSLPFSITSDVTKSDHKIGSCGYDFILTLINKSDRYNLYNFENPSRSSISFQNIEKINELFTKKTVETDIIDSRYIMENTAGINLTIHLYAFLEEHLGVSSTMDFINKIIPIIIKYPNTFSRLFLIDELLYFFNDKCTKNGEQPSYTDLQNTIINIISDNNDLIKQKYTAMRSAVYYVINKINIRDNYNSIKPLEIVESLLSFYDEKCLPWSISNFRGVILTTPATNTVQAQFSGTIPSNDKFTNFYKFIQNEIIKEMHKWNAERISQ